MFGGSFFKLRSLQLGGRRGGFKGWTGNAACKSQSSNFCGNMDVHIWRNEARQGGAEAAEEIILIQTKREVPHYIARGEA